MRQATFQLERNMLLYGMNPVNGEGLLNAAGAVAITLPPDSSGNDTVVTYDSYDYAAEQLGAADAIAWPDVSGQADRDLQKVGRGLF